MVDTHREWEAELGGGAVGCWDGAGGEESVGGRGCRNRSSLASLRPPPLFRSISPTGVSAGMPPHRRLRAMFRRSRAVLPTVTRGMAPSQTRVRGDALSQTGGLMGSPVRTREFANAPLPTARLPRQATPPSAPPWQATVLIRQCGGQPCPQPALSPKTCRERKGSWHGAGAVTPAGEREEPKRGAEERKTKTKRKKRQRRKEGRRENDPGKERWGLPAHNAERGEDRALCGWLESLGLTDAEKDTPSVMATPNRLAQALQEVGSVKRRADPGGQGAEPSRRDRRPYFLPPLPQCGSLLDVPLLLPKNSPPPSPCSSPGAPLFPLPVPRLQPLPPTRK